LRRVAHDAVEAGAGAVAERAQLAREIVALLPGEKRHVAGAGERRAMADVAAVAGDQLLRLGDHAGIGGAVGRRRLPGREEGGEVVEIGAKVRSFKKGDLVTRPVAIWPGTARDGLFSGWGGYAEYGIVRDRIAMAADGDASLERDYTALRENVVPAGMSVKEACAALSLAETASWTWNLPPIANRNVVIAGTGSAGFSIALWCKFAQAKNVVVLGRRDERLSAACTFGADAVVNVKRKDPASAVSGILGAKADIFIEAAGAKENLTLGPSLLADGGVFALYGVFQGMASNIAQFKEINKDILFMQPPANEHLAYRWTCDMIRRRLIPLDAFMTHSFTIDDYPQAFAALERGEVVKGMITFA